MKWGYALVWMPPYLARDPDPLMAKLKFLEHYGLKVTGIGLEEATRMEEARLTAVAECLRENDLHLHLYTHLPFFESDQDRLKSRTEKVLKSLAVYAPILRTPLVTTAVGSVHRFVRRPSLTEQMECLSHALAPLAQGCHDLGLPLGIENHGDYYCSDLAGLCREVPHLGIFLDTGNTYLIGESPLPAFQAAAPYVVGTHFKDHRVRPCPDARPLHFEVGPSVIGEGDVPLRECFHLLLERAPRPKDLVMEIEFIPPCQEDPVAELERSLAFIRRLQEEMP